MIKYYTRACNFYYGKISKEKVFKKVCLPLNGNKLISFDTIELISRKKKKFIKIKDIKKLPLKLKKKINEDLKKITKFKSIKNLKFKSSPLLMGILNTTPDSFSDGGKYLTSYSAYNHIKKLKKEGAEIIDIGGESTRPNSKTVDSKIEWNRVKSKIKYANIILDPGIGFGKNLKHNITILNQISIFHSLGFPVMLGISKKRFIKDIAGNNDSIHRTGGTTSSSIYAFLQGVQILRVHDVNEIKQAMKVINKIIFNI